MALLGIVLGRLMATGAVRLLGATVAESLRQQPARADRAHAGRSLLLGLAIGIGSFAGIGGIAGA